MHWKCAQEQHRTAVIFVASDLPIILLPSCMYDSLQAQNSIDYATLVCLFLTRLHTENPVSPKLSYSHFFITDQFSLAVSNVYALVQIGQQSGIEHIIEDLAINDFHQSKTPPPDPYTVYQFPSPVHSYTLVPNCDFLMMVSLLHLSWLSLG